MRLSLIHQTLSWDVKTKKSCHSLLAEAQRSVLRRQGAVLCLGQSCEP